jgi:putative transposase
MFVVKTERFLSNFVNKYGLHSVSSDGDDIWWYPQACRFLKLAHHLHSSFEKSTIIERMMQYIKDRMEILMIIFLVKKGTNVN